MLPPVVPSSLPLRRIAPYAHRINVKKEGIVLRKTDLPFESVGVLNPAVIRIGADIHMYYRAVAKGNYSSIGYCRLLEPTIVVERWDKPILSPEHGYESQGMEDPRIVKIEDQLYLTYQAFDSANALGAVAVSHDLKHFDKLGLIVPKITYEEFRELAEIKGRINSKYLRYNEQRNSREKQGRKKFIWDKNVVFFPRKINGKLHFLHRIRPDIQCVTVNDLRELTPEFWRDYFMNLEEHIVLTARYGHEVSYIGGGCPPIETSEGWLLIYHGVHDTINGYVYSACAALLDLKNPQKEIARLPYPLFSPEEPWELTGIVNNVCFPTGSVTIGQTLYIYYGAADEHIACASVHLPELIKELLLHPMQIKESAL